jgi:serine/threonine protein phosphatase PrpC
MNVVNACTTFMRNVVSTTRNTTMKLCQDVEERRNIQQARYIAQKIVNASHIKFSFVTAKIADHGEDADPIITLNESMGLIAVLDGMGGSGSEKYQTADGQTHTGAYLGARYTRDCLEQWFMTAGHHTITAPVLEDLKQVILTHLNNKLSTLSSQPSLIRSKMRRTLPTTLASIFYTVHPKQTQLDVVWAGDSRAHLLTPNGLRQLSNDDADVHEETYAGIMQDAPLTNCISTNVDFHLNHHRYTKQLPTIIMVCTDGCYGFLNSPVHVEELLLTCLNTATTATEWGALVSKRLQPIAGDDCAMALVCVGWKNFDSVKRAFQSRTTSVSELVHALDAPTNGEITPAKEELFARYWNQYRYRRS